MVRARHENPSSIPCVNHEGAEQCSKSVPARALVGQARKPPNKARSFQPNVAPTRAIFQPLLVFAPCGRMGNADHLTKLNITHALVERSARVASLIVEGLKGAFGLLDQQSSAVKVDRAVHAALHQARKPS